MPVVVLQEPGWGFQRWWGAMRGWGSGGEMTHVAAGAGWHLERGRPGPCRARDHGGADLLVPCMSPSVLSQDIPTVFTETCLI